VEVVEIDATTTAEPSQLPKEDRTDELIAELRERLSEAKGQLRKSDERADRYEAEAIELRRANASLVAQLMPPAHSPTPKPGFFGRLFSR
jgi:predicted phage gp36 major capsid-like protein